MAKFNSTKNDHKTLNHKGAVSYKRTAKMDLFLSAIGDFREDSYYESSSNRMTRTRDLVKEVMKEDPQWILPFVEWLRNKANIRTMAIAIAVEAAMLADGKTVSGRQIINAAMSRADEPGEVLSYFKESFPNTPIPSKVKRAVADGANRLYNEYSVLKYDSSSREFRMGDVINISHPKPENSKQADVFKLALDRRYSSDVESSLEMVKNRKKYLALSEEDKRTLISSKNGSATLKAAGLTWENVISDLPGDKKDLWEALIPTMGYMALLRNLRNFESADISLESWEKVYSRISSKEEVENSRQMPFRFLSAFRSISDSHSRLKSALEKAVSHSLSNIPELPGKSLIFLDLSGSMFYSHSSNSSASWAQTATLFAHAMAHKSESAKLVAFGSYSEELKIPKKFEGILSKSEDPDCLGGTNFRRALEDHYTPDTFDRVIVITDEQYGYHYDYDNQYSGVSEPVYVWNMLGYAPSSVSNGNTNVVQLGGLTAESFKMIHLVDGVKKGIFPWES